MKVAMFMQRTDDSLETPARGYLFFILTGHDAEALEAKKLEIDVSTMHKHQLRNFFRDEISSGIICRTLSICFCPQSSVRAYAQKAIEGAHRTQQHWFVPFVPLDDVCYRWHKIQ